MRESLVRFRCSLDQDIQEFINQKALDFQGRGWSSVYLLFDKEKLQQGIYSLEAYFTLSHKAIALSSGISKTKRKQVFGGINNPSSFAHFVLIGHLGKHISQDRKSEVSSKEILDSVFEVIEESKKLITFNCVLIECRKLEAILRVYKNYGFNYFQEDDLLQLIKRV